jgi:hypothetical protein
MTGDDNFYSLNGTGLTSTAVSMTAHDIFYLENEAGMKVIGVRHDSL